MAYVIYNNVKMSVSGTPGTGAVTLGSALTGFQSFSSGGAANADTFPYRLEDGSSGAWEIGIGTYSTTGPTVTRTTITASSNAGAAINATSAAVIMCASLSADIPTQSNLLAVAKGGTGLASGTSGGVLYYSATGTLASSAVLTASALVIGGGAGVAPSTTTTGTGVITAIGSNTNSANGLAVLNSSGYLALAQGGANANLSASNGGIVYSTASALGILAGTATANQILVSGSSTTPAWSTATYPTTATAGTLLTAGSANTITASATPTLGVAGTTAGTLTLSGLTSGTVKLQTAAAAGTGTIFQFPASGGTSGYALTTDGTGVASWNALTAAGGGTGQTTYTVGDILYASASTTLSKLSDVATGNALISGGTSTAPSWGKIGLTTHVSGTLAVGNGGTGLTSYTVGDILYASTTSALSALNDVATGNALISGGTSTAPSWGKIGLTTHITGTLAVGNGGTGLTTLTTGYIPFGAGTSAFNSTSSLFWDNTNVRLGVGTSSPTKSIYTTNDIGANGSQYWGPGVGSLRGTNIYSAEISWQYVAGNSVYFNLSDSAGNNGGGMSIVFRGLTSSGGGQILLSSITLYASTTYCQTVSKSGGSFRIDHPLPSMTDTHNLIHSFVESPDANNIYRGVVTLVNGSATVNLDQASRMTEGTFVLLNRETQAFVSNQTSWDAVKASVTGNILTIQCQNTNSTDSVSWLVIGMRQDKYMFDTDWTDSNGYVIVEPLKPSAQP